MNTTQLKHAARVVAAVPALLLSRDAVKTYGWRGSMKARNNLATMKGHPVWSIVYIAGTLAGAYFTFREAAEAIEDSPIDISAWGIIAGPIGIDGSEDVEYIPFDLLVPRRLMPTDAGYTDSTEA